MPFLVYSMTAIQIILPLNRQRLDIEEADIVKADLKKYVIAAMFAALTFAATMVVRIPTPGVGGYIHLGDALVILSGVILGPSYGFLAAGIGSALADLLGGYLIYVPITFVIKGLVALLSGSIYQKAGKDVRSRYHAVAAGGVVDILMVVGGYLLFGSVLYGPTGTLASVPADLIQGISGLIISLFLYPALMTVPDIKRMLLIR